MSFLEICGGKPLFGRVSVSGSKNAALPIIFAALTVNGVSVIENVPDIGDVRIAIDILSDFGAEVERVGDMLRIDTRNVRYEKPDGKKTSKIRASSYLIGASLSRFGRIDVSEIGGCNFCRRPIDMHLFAAERLGAQIKEKNLTAKSLKGNEICFDKVSVGATINALIMAASASGETIIKGGAREPHVKNLVDFLVSAGAMIEDNGETVRVVGKPLSDARARIIPDMIEAGTFLLLGPLTEGKVTVAFEGNLGLDSFFDVLSECGISLEIKKGAVSSYGAPDKKINITTAPYPGFPTDLQPQCAPLMAKYLGGCIRENVWENRFSYLSELSRLGVKSHISGGDTAMIYPSDLKCADADAPDLRGGAAIIMAALAAEGTSRIGDIEKTERGYQGLSSKLRALGACIK